MARKTHGPTCLYRVVVNGDRHFVVYAKAGQRLAEVVKREAACFGLVVKWLDAKVIGFCEFMRSDDRGQTDSYWLDVINN